MAKIISYKYISCEINHGTEEKPDIEQIILDKSIICSTEAQYDANMPIAEMEAIPGTLDRDPLGEFDPEPETLSDADRIAELEAAMELLLSGVTE